MDAQRELRVETVEILAKRTALGSQRSTSRGRVDIQYYLATAVMSYMHRANRASWLTSSADGTASVLLVVNLPPLQRPGSRGECAFRDN
jgi:hypothetical protein